VWVHDPELNDRYQPIIEEMLAGRFDRATELLEEVLAEMESTGPRDDLGAQLVREKLALSYQHTGRYEEAVALAERAVTGYREILGPDAVETLGVQTTLAFAYTQVGREPEAVALQEETARSAVALI
jgi:tetratricopeptide (TPR) repeat protein